MKVEATQEGSEDSSPPAREFDGTFNVKPQVYGTYLNQDQYEGGEGRGGGGGGGEQREEYRRGEFRDRRYDPPPHPPHHERERPHDYNYPPPPRARSPHDFPYSPEPEHGSRPLSAGGMQFVSRDYSHGQGRRYDEAEYGDRLPPPSDREDRFGREYPPPSEHFRGPSPSQRERDREQPTREIDLAFHCRWSPSTIVTVACPPMSSLLTITTANPPVPPTTADSLPPATTTTHLPGTPLHLDMVPVGTLPMTKDFTPLPLINTPLVVLVQATFLV